MPPPEETESARQTEQLLSFLSHSRLARMAASIRGYLESGSAGEDDMASLQAAIDTLRDLERKAERQKSQERELAGIALRVRLSALSKTPLEGDAYAVAGTLQREFAGNIFVAIPEIGSELGLLRPDKSFELEAADCNVDDIPVDLRVCVSKTPSVETVYVQYRRKGSETVWSPLPWES